jgi:biopolymer transport protein ExbB|tara:strand:- start:994 stop:1497 length:504 start_codon:yes stop_codon:yes gene_type:complete
MIGLEDLFSRGGPVLYLLFLVTLFIWFIIIFKYLFNVILDKDWVKTEYNNYSSNLNDSNKEKFEDFFLIRVRRVSTYRLKTLDGLIALCPMLGLLGTVYGMIEVFEVLAVLGTGNPRAMSTGVAKATIPTMAGMTIALSGLFFKFDLNNKVEEFERQAREILRYEKI